MLIPFTSRRRLVSTLDALALYNEKGIYWSRHSAEVAKAERDKAIEGIRALISRIGAQSLPAEFIEGLRSGEVATDMTGKYVNLVRAHFGK